MGELWDDTPFVGEWHVWFARHPVLVQVGTWIHGRPLFKWRWLRPVYRQWHYNGYLYRDIKYHVKELLTSNDLPTPPRS